MSGDSDDWMVGLKGRMQNTTALRVSPPAPSAIPMSIDSPPPPPASIAGLPEELVVQICEEAEYSRTLLLALRSSCRYLRNITTPMFFRHVKLTVDTKVYGLYKLLNGEGSYRFLGPADDAPEKLKSLWTPGFIPITDIAPGPYASTLLMHSIRHLSIGPRNRDVSIPLDPRFVLQLLPRLRVLEIVDDHDRILNNIARVLRAHHKNTIERFVYQGPCLDNFGTRNPFARAFGDCETLREVELLNTDVSNAPWIYPAEVGLDDDWSPADDKLLGFQTHGTVWYRPDLVFPEPPVRLPSRLTTLRLRNIGFKAPEPANPPKETIARLREYGPHILEISAKGKEKETHDSKWKEWPPALLPVARLIMCSPNTLTTLGLEGIVGGKEVFGAVMYALREIGPRLESIALRKWDDGDLVVKLLALCTCVTHVRIDCNGERDSTPVLCALPASTRTLEVWPPFDLENIKSAIDDDILHVRRIDITADHWKLLVKDPWMLDPMHHAIQQGRLLGIEIDLGKWAALLNEVKTQKMWNANSEQEVEMGQHEDEADEQEEEDSDETDEQEVEDSDEDETDERGVEDSDEDDPDVGDE